MTETTTEMMAMTSSNDERVCGRYVVLGSPNDPYASECDLPPHGPETKHEGLNPFGDGKVRWFGGGGVAGDRLPYRELEFVDPIQTDEWMDEQERRERRIWGSD